MRHVATPQGRLRGRLVSSPDGDAWAFLGIPYAGMGGGRFRAAAEPESWSGTRDATEFGPGSPQRADRADTFVMDEDACLNLNIWTPGEAVSGAPVLVWIHGGAHLYGSNTHPLCDGARFAAAHGVVVVAINYRLGALGYLTLDHLLGAEFADANNLALLDALAALTWLQDSIGDFGGDPGNVTVMGQSAGAVMTATLLGMSASTGLFRRAIVESGSAERAGTVAFGQERTAELLSLLDLDDASAERLLDLPTSDLVTAADELITRRSAGTPNLSLAFRPIIDGNWLHDLPVRMIAGGMNAEVDLLAGTNVNESSGSVDVRRPDDQELADELRRQVGQLLPHEGDADDVGEGDVDDYRSALDHDLGRRSTLAEALEACMADRIYRQPMQRLLDARHGASGSTFAYLFGWERPDAGWARRAGHSLELPFVFRHLDDSEAARLEVGPAPPLSTGDFMSKAWATYAATGAPDGGAPWKPYDVRTRSTMIIDASPHQQDDPRSQIRRLVTDRHDLAQISAQRPPVT